MPKLLLGLLLTLALALPNAAIAREKASLNAAWMFHKGDVPTASDPNFQADTWQAIELPHTYNASDAGAGGDKARGEEEGVYYRGPAWYRRDLTVTPQPGKRYFLQFEGAALITEAYLNGKSVGRHDGGYATFRFDITDALKSGRNVLAVKVDNTRVNHIAPLTGDFNVFGGLYRNVWLVTADGIHVDLMDHGGPGVYATTKTITNASADIHVKSLIRNDTATSAPVKVRTTILDASGKTVAQSTTTFTVAANTTVPTETNLTVKKPRLWAGRSAPYLYTVKIETGSDTVTVPLGVRTFTIDVKNGVLLNGKPYAVYGANMQQPGRYGKGTAVSDAEIDEDMQIMDEMGVTALRLAHMQHHPRVYEEADRRGILISTEAPLVDFIDASDAFKANAVQQMQELIAQNYNHPSVVVWGLGNEIRSNDPDPNPVLAALQSTAKAMDTSRPTAYAHCCLADDDPVALHSDIVSYNKYFGWYWGEFEDIGKWADEVHAKLPNRVIGISEYGAGASILHQEDLPKRTVPQAYWHPEQYQSAYHEANWKVLKARPYLWSNFIWVAFDFPSFRRNEGDRPAINDKGLVTEDRKVRKDAYYWYQANWSDKPMVHITSSRDTPKRVRKVTVKVYSNAAEVRLRLNGVDLAVQPVVDHMATWKIELKDGDNVIEATAGDITDQVMWSYTDKIG
ncbi:glycosyl hydrolase family 2 [Asticcacaulis sp. AC460]|uniref:glycoside hydrolase family 2 protein n=1 Tax=Asticcacaulis sp. AC460 TaxID=1282360 RepID=UPI0003C3EF46|nr:glycoside hydrolase family 2 TIM barrel-domain containing protein [Asticcacaulis sp. AC460]ESQ88347.1 glycosyl hydrolase family 2 [Asticcacaulis sp. AC460]